MVETCFDVPIFSVLKEYRTFRINHALIDPFHSSFDRHYTGDSM